MPVKKKKPVARKKLTTAQIKRRVDNFLDKDPLSSRKIDYLNMEVKPFKGFGRPE